MKNHFLLLLITIIAFACAKDETPGSGIAPQPSILSQDTIPYKIKWAKFMNEADSTQYGYTDTYLYNNVLVLNRDKTFEFSDENIVYARDPETGEILWEWDEFELYYDVHGTVERIATFENYYLVKFWDALYCIDTNTGQTVWTQGPSNEYGLKSSFFAIGENVYFTTDNYEDESSSIFQLNIKTGSQRYFYTAQKNGDVEAHLRSATEGLNSDGDTIIVFQDRKIDDTQVLVSERSWVQLLAYNLSADSLLWKIDTLETQSGSSVAVNPIIEGNWVYFVGKSIYSLSLDDGSIRWKNEEITSLFWEFVLYKNTLLASEANSITYGINPANGNIKWANDLNGGSVTSIEGYGIHAYVCSNQIYIIHVNSGEVEHILPLYNRTIDSRVSFLSGRPSITENGKYVYISDTFFDICFENPAI